VQPSGRLPPLVGAPGLEKRSSFATKLRSSMGFGDMFGQQPVSNPLQPPVDAIFLTNTRIASSLLLQQLLYYNCWFSPCWGVAVLVSYLVKFENGTLKDKLNDNATTEDELAVILGSVWLLIEPIRLRLGYTGNLKEKVRLCVRVLQLKRARCTDGMHGPLGTGCPFVVRRPLAPHTVRSRGPRCGVADGVQYDTRGAAAVVVVAGAVPDSVHPHHGVSAGGYQRLLRRRAEGRGCLRPSGGHCLRTHARLPARRQRLRGMWWCRLRRGSPIPSVHGPAPVQGVGSCVSFAVRVRELTGGALTLRA